MNALLQKTFFSSPSITSDSVYTADIELESGEWAVFLFHQLIKCSIICPLIVVQNTRQLHSSGNQGLLQVSESNSETMKKIYKSKQLGPLYFFSGFPALLVYTTANDVLKPLVEDSLNAVFDIYDQVHPVTNIFSHLSVSFLTSPLLFAFTRLSIQSPSKTNGYYWSFFSVFQSLKIEEPTFKWTDLYSMRLVLPLVAIEGSKATLEFISDAIIEEFLGLNHSQLTYLIFKTILKFASLFLESVLLVPFEISLKRLWIQSITVKNPNPFPTMIATSAAWYSGVWSCLNSMIRSKEEMSKLQRIRQDLSKEEISRLELNKKKKESTSLKLLFKGFWLRYSVRVIEYTLNSLVISQDFN